MIAWWAPPFGEGEDGTGADTPLEDLTEDLAEDISEGIPEGLLDGIPDNLADAEHQLSPALAEFLDAEAAQIVLPLLAIAFVSLIVGLIRRQLAAPPDSATPGPPAAAAALSCVALYLFGRLVDPLLTSLLTRPAWFPADSWAEVGWFEWKLLGRPWAWGALPLEHHPSLALLVHAVVWTGVWLVLRFGFEWLWAGPLRWSAPTRDLPWYFRWVGSSTTRRADQRFRHWLGALLSLLIPAHALTGLHLVEHPGSLPAPGMWITGGLLMWTTAFHLMVTGKEPAPEDKREEEEEEEDEPRPDLQLYPLARMRLAVEQLRPGVQLEALELRDAVEGERAEFPALIAPLVREIFHDLTGERAPWAHQAELLAHLGGLWSMQAAPERSESPSLEEERGAAVISRAETSTPHALILAPEGSGRTTTTLLAALHVYLDRGATSLVIVRERAAARRWASTLGQALTGSSARWNVLSCTAGEDLAQALVADRTPAIVIADLEACEAEVLSDPRTDDFLSRLGLIVADDVDGFTGVAEMHLQMCMRRLWAILDRLHAAPYPAALLATASESAVGMDAWAKHVLAAPLRVFADDRAPSRPQVLLRRRDLVDGGGADIPLATLAEACEAAGLPWHLRLAGDGARGVRRALFDLGNLRRFHRDDPSEAAVVIVEGTYPEVRREAARLAHAGAALVEAVDRPGDVVLPVHARAPAVLVLAPPGDEEMVLHEEAVDAEHRELVASLPRAVALAEPRVVRQRHFDRAVGREQDLDALRERFGQRFVDETVASLGSQLRRREVLHIDPHSDEIISRTQLRSIKEGALGQPIDAGCVSDRSARTRIVDAGTSEVLYTLDSAVVRAVFPPGAIFLHPRGRFMVSDAPDGQELSAEQIGGHQRSTPDRALSLQADATIEWSDRQFGGHSLPVALASVQLSEHLFGMRRFAPGPKLVDHRIYERPLTVRYGTDACLIAAAPISPDAAATAEGEDQADDARLAPSDEALIPLAAAIRMILPCYLRGAAGLVDVDLVEHRGQRLLCIFDRTPGASGFARFVYERGLKELLELASMVLERLVGPEFARLRHIHDRAVGSDPARWCVGEALRWLDALLVATPPVADEQPEALDSPEGPRIAFTPGEGRGDLGRLWISQSGRTDDLVWTRHAWTSAASLAGHPPGRVFIDIALERPAIAAARRRAAGALGERFALGRRERLDLDSREAHVELLSADRADLDPVREKLAALCGPALIEAVLALVAAIPLSPRPLTLADRGPLAVLSRRRADLDAKMLLACALLPEAAQAEIVAGPPPSEEPWLRVDHGGSEGFHTWALGGPRPRRVDPEPARRATLLID
ncbi:hypothetical protein G6O69_24245 [Pseudenhygromyxa sp. WMMC2535]|uniref:DEAD/DEAH box helicase n=1 Tax=Pseudenhygromyxa sp. WMMC2535 TaxID=2712867 RepID=UPI0015566B21|nr:DEAD/DEAH box helicase [Pseudenhygromyxa sp. WMMC2535]NVB40973.1 hypothetical protein [Pseudenhygromyxa sp. WMMC2535]